MCRHLARRWDWLAIRLYTPTFAGPGLLGTGPGLAFTPIFAGLGLLGTGHPNFCRPGIARDWPGIGHTPLFDTFCKSGIARDWSGIGHTPLFAGPGLLGTGPEWAIPQFLQVWGCSGLARDCPYPNFCKSGIARDWPRIGDWPYPNLCRPGMAYPVWLL